MLNRHLIACSHTRAIELYIDSLKEGESCVMVGHECTTYEEFQMGYCFSCGPGNEHCAIMGYRAEEYKPIVDKYARSNVRFYLNTGKGQEDPFCRNEFIILNLNVFS